MLLHELRTSGFNVQKPVLNKEMDYVTKIEHPDNDSKLLVTILKWVDGQTIDINEEQNKGLVSNLATEMAKMHIHLKRCSIKI